MQLPFDNVELVVLRAKRNAALSSLRDAVASGREWQRLFKAATTVAEANKAIRGYFASRSAWEAADAAVLDAKRSLANCYRKYNQLTRNSAISNVSSATAPNQYILQLGDLKYKCVIIERHGQFAAQFTCYQCAQTFTSICRFATERDGAFRLKALIYAEHHKPVHDNPRQVGTDPSKK